MKKYCLRLVKVEVSILILLDYLFLSGENFDGAMKVDGCFNPYFIGLPILIGKRWKKEILRKVSILILLDYLFL